MSTSILELNVSFPPDERFARTARDLVMQAGRQAGLDEARTRSVAEQIEEGVRSAIGAAPANGASVPLVVRLSGQTVEVVLNGRSLRLDPA